MNSYAEYMKDPVTSSTKNLERSLQARPGEIQFMGNYNTIGQTAAKLSQANALTGQGIFGVGADADQYRNLVQQRLAGADPQSQYLMEGRNRSKADVGRAFAGRGVAGGVAAAGMAQAGREADVGINAQMFENQRTNQKDLDNLTTKNQKVFGNALAQSEDRGLADNLNTNAGQGILPGKIICTELNRQGLLPNEVQAADKAYGRMIAADCPEVFAGYMLLAAPIVRQMRKSARFTKVIAAIAIPWAYHIAGKKNWTGWLVNTLGTPLCYLAGVLTANRKVVA